MSSGPNQPTSLLVVLVVCVMAVAGAMVAAVLVAGSRSVVVVMPEGGPGADRPALPPAGGAQASAAAGSGGAPPSAPPAPKAVVVAVMRVPAAPAVDDPFDPAWDSLPIAEIPLLPQQMAMPMLDTVTVPAIQFQGARDDRRIIFRLTWSARAPAAQTETGEFGDAVAMQFPMVDGAPFTMGGKGQPVRLLHWKALWQKDLDVGFQGVAQRWPNAWSDPYLFPTRAGGAPVSDQPPAEHPLGFEPLRSAGNPMAQTSRRQPIEELVAEGFGTSTHVPDSPSAARGRWRDGKWSVVIDRPLAPGDPLAQRLTSAAQNLVSLAVWDGSAGNRGGRKHYCAWIPLKIEP